MLKADLNIPKVWIEVSAINNEQLIINNYPFLKEGDLLKGFFLVYPLKMGG